MSRSAILPSRRVRGLLICATMAAAASAGFAHLSAQQGQHFDDVEYVVRHVQGQVHLLASGAGANTVVQAGDAGVLVVDPGFAPLGEKLFAAIRTLSPKAIHYVINTHVHDDHTGGNEFLAGIGTQRPDRHPLTSGVGGNTGGTVAIVAHENVTLRMATEGPDRKPGTAWPNDTYFADRREIYFNGEAVQLFHVPAAHTDGDSIVFFRRSDVIAAGDLFTTTMYPFIDVARGGHVNGIIDGLNLIIDLAVPDLRVQEGGTMIVPGHGRLADEQDVIEYRDMLTIVRDRIQAMVKKGMTLEQVKAARPTLDWDARYGSDTGFWTTSQFVETIYANLSPRATSQGR
jgi:cyclase